MIQRMAASAALSVILFLAVRAEWPDMGVMDRFVSTVCGLVAAGIVAGITWPRRPTRGS